MTLSFESTLVTGTVLENRYRIRGLLGQGGMSRVYLADAIQLGVPVAVKENLQTSADARSQFDREAQMLARLAHPNIPRVTDRFTDPSTGRQYLVMEYIEGEDLAAMIKRVGALPEATALNWIQQILGAVEYLHSQQPPVIHRDIKPANIKITPQGKAVLVDFGIAKVYDPGKGTVLGARATTPGYAAPEQYGMRTTERSDIYSLGATLYTMVSGHVPPEATLRVAGEEKLIPPSQIVPGQISSSTERAILQAMEMETGKRWQSAPQMRAALEKQNAIPEMREGQTVYVSKPIVKHAGGSNIPLAIAAIVGAVLVCTLVTAVFVWQSRSIVQMPAPTLVVAISTPTSSRVAIATSAPTISPPPPPTPTLGIGSTKISPIDGAYMVYVPPGNFTMGSDNGNSDEKPVRTIYLDGFWIDQFLVTNGLYGDCEKASKCQRPFQNNSFIYNPYHNNPQYVSYPVIYVSWDDANDYCRWAGKRLPTEAEWEKAARGTDGRVYPWGNTWDGTKLNSWDSTLRLGDTTAVGAYPNGASPYGALDMAGNVWNWVSDWYGSNYYASSPTSNPKGPLTGIFRVLRGGSWGSGQLGTRSSYRSYLTSAYRDSYIGFRCAE